MSDELRQWLSRASKKDRPTPIHPCLCALPRVQGGLSLDGGPRLDIEPAAMAAVNAGTEAARTAAAHPLPCPDEPSLALPAAPQGPVAVSCRGLLPHPTPADWKLLALDLEKSYRKGPVAVPVLRGLSLDVRPGEFLAIAGQSGSGKSTLLHLLGTLDAPDRGEIHFDGRRIDNLPVAQRDALRNRRLGMIFQFYHLLPELTTLENVLAPLMIRQSVWGFLRNRRAHYAAAGELLETVGLGHRLKHRPRELSGGEMQRAAIARALVARPDLLLADEPTGNLDQRTGADIVKILRDLNDRQNLTIVMVTHDPAIADRADRIVRLANGRIES